jgi:hypothetical protein
VVSPSSLSLHVERDETAVDLHVDGGHVRTIGPKMGVTMTPADPFQVAVVPASRDRFG